MRHVWQKLAVALPQGLPIVTVHVGRVEEIAVAPPHFVEDVVPFRDRVFLQHQPGGRDGFLCAGAGRCCVVHVPDLLLADKHFRPIIRDHKSAYIFNQLGLFRSVETVFFVPAPDGVASYTFQTCSWRTSTFDPSYETTNPPISSTSLVSLDLKRRFSLCRRRTVLRRTRSRPAPGGQALSTHHTRPQIRLYLQPAWSLSGL